MISIKCVNVEINKQVASHNSFLLAIQFLLYARQPRATNPPTWDEGRDTAAAIGSGGAGSGMAGAGERPASRGVRGAVGLGGDAAGSVTVRPVWLALAGGKLFLREKVIFLCSCTFVSYFTIMVYSSVLLCTFIAPCLVFFFFIVLFCPGGFFANHAVVVSCSCAVFFLG